MLLKFIYRLLLFCLPVLVLLVYAEFSLRNAHNYYGEKYGGFKEHIHDIEFLFLGTSHTDNAIYPEVFDGLAYNLAIGSQSIYYDTEIINKNIDELTSLKAVFFSIDYHNLYFDHVPSRDFAYNHYYDIPPPIEAKGGSRFKLMTFEYGFKKTLIELKRPSYDLINGYDLNQSHDTNSFTKKWIRDRVDHFNETIRNGKLVKDYLIIRLRQSIKLLKSKGITPIILTAPCHKSILKHLSTHQIDEIKKIVKGLCDEFNIEHWDYLKLDLDKSYFVNPDHLNYKGAKLFSKMLNERLIENDY